MQETTQRKVGVTQRSRLESKAASSCLFTIVANVEFVKSTMLKGRIESECWAGLEKTVGLLEAHLAAAASPGTATGPAAPPAALHRPAPQARQERAPRPPRPARIKLYPDNYQYTGQIILLVILLILTMLVVSLFKLSWTLERIDQRLSNIELTFNALNFLEPDEDMS